MLEHVSAWLLSAACRELDGRALICALVAKLHESALDFDRLGLSIRTRHPEVWVESYRWTREAGLRHTQPDNDLTQRASYLDSPVAELHAGADEIHLALPEQAARYPVTSELAQQGYRDYVAFALPAKQRSFVSLATRRPEGFSRESIAALRALTPALSLRVELASERLAMESLLRTYLGPNAAQHVLEGQFRRGRGRPIEAVIWSCDLRGFTKLVDSTEIAQVLRTLDAYFECVADPIAAHGGEVLKFIGDAVLAIFTAPEDAAQGSMLEPSLAALAAAREAFAKLELLNSARAARGQAALAFGLALHRGVVTYGNIGAHRRLDFTVIGPAVNEVTRVESLCKSTGEPLLLTAAFARACDVPRGPKLRALGLHQLRGVTEPVELFTLDGLVPG